MLKRRSTLLQAGVFPLTQHDDDPINPDDAPDEAELDLAEALRASRLKRLAPPSEPVEVAHVIDVKPPDGNVAKSLETHQRRFLSQGGQQQPARDPGSRAFEATPGAKNRSPAACILAPDALECRETVSQVAR
jgi:hypothetical protein